jgi:hypothetical protein
VGGSRAIGARKPNYQSTTGRTGATTADSRRQGT